MREIKFRGRSIEDGKTWYTGQYYIEYSAMPHPIRTQKSPSLPSNTHWIVFPSFADWGMPREMQRVQIDHETLGQFTGLKGKNGKEIYEGDILKNEYGTTNFFVEYQSPSFVLRWLTTSGRKSKSWTEFVISYKERQLYPIIGNIYENPELLK